MAMHLPATERAPTHVALIMDGNRRWAVQRGLPIALGYEQGIEALDSTVRAALDSGVQVLTVYGFSTENWKRESSEVALLMNVCAQFARSRCIILAQRGVRV